MDTNSRDGPRMADLINDRSDIPKLRERLKQMAKQRRDAGEEDFKVDDLLAQSRKNDAAYIAPSDLEKAEWFADIYEQEGEPEEHPRAMYYRLLGKGYRMRNGEPFEQSHKCWRELKDAIKWARILGLVDGDRISDSDSKTGGLVTHAFDDVDRPLPDAGLNDLRDASAHTRVDDGYRGASIPDSVRLAQLRFDDASEFIHVAAQTLVEHTFEEVYFDAHSEQRYYIEMWSEKSGVLPDDLAADYGATVRPSDGEFSLNMAREALKIARDRNQDLAIIIVSDFDSAGHDMPVSASRKLEVEGAIHGVEVEVAHAAVTKEQVEKYALPGVPSRMPNGLEQDIAGAKGYETQKEIFREYAGQYPVEIQGFSSTHPEGYRAELEAILEQYHDAELGERIKDAVRDAQQDAYHALVDAFDQHRDEIQEALDELSNAMDNYHDRMEPAVDAALDGLNALERQEKKVRERVGIPKKRSALVNTLDAIDHRDVLAGVDVQLPDPHTSGVENPLLDTRRAMMEQLDAYQTYNMRHD